MWQYQKKLQFPINIKHANPQLASYIISQYGGPNGEIGEFGYSVAPDGIALYIEAAECAHRSVIINGLPGDLYLPKDRSSRTELLWVDDSTGTMFTLGFQVDPEVLISIAETIQVKSD